ncbi:MAG: phage tail protein [Proteobacteria bacterium SG_bin5]|nr:MAG: phage tail protein [Proteobacteria bacterium SG_bin5]
MTYFHGILVTEPVDGVRPILEKSTAVIGLVATATAAAGAATQALDAAFPVNRPVLITDVRRAVGLAGTGGTLARALSAIADQGSPLVVVVRVAPGQNAAATEQAIIGGAVGGSYQGLQALLAAEALVGVRPRILGVPGLDSQAVVTALLPVAKRLRGMIYAAARPQAALAATIADAVTYRGEFSARELMLLWPDATGWDGQAVATALGVRAALDETVGWHRALSNIPVEGFTGINKDVNFDIRDNSTDAGALNAAQITTIVRQTGYRFWGVRTCSDEPFFAFEPATRTAQAIQDAIADAQAVFVDRPMTPSLVRDIVETANATLRRWTTQGRLIGGRCWYDAAANPTEALAGGQLVIDYDYTPAAPLEGLTLNQRITAKYYSGFGDALASAVTR